MQHTIESNTANSTKVLHYLTLFWSRCPKILLRKGIIEILFARQLIVDYELRIAKLLNGIEQFVIQGTMIYVRARLDTNTTFPAKNYAMLVLSILIG